MGVHKIGEYDIAIKFIGVYTHMAVWQYAIKKGNKLIASSPNHPTVELDESKAVLEIALDGLLYVGQQLEEIERGAPGVFH